MQRPGASYPTVVDAGELSRRMIDDFAAYIATVHALQDGPEFHDQLSGLDCLARNLETDDRRALADYALRATEPELRHSRIISHGRDKPFGYSGDFQIIDWTYQRATPSDTARGRFWDEFYHAQIAPLAVCERKNRFGLELVRLQAQRAKRVRILSVGSGPARELVEGIAIANLLPTQVEAICIDNDVRAIEYAKTLIPESYRSSVHFHKGNALRYRSQTTFDFIWSAGLFDYLNHKQSVFLLRALWQMLAAGGRLVVGNFSDTHRTRAWIEWCGSWYLEHRSSEDLETIGRQAGIPTEAFRTEIDPLEAIRFLVADHTITI